MNETESWLGAWADVTEPGSVLQFEPMALMLWVLILAGVWLLTRPRLGCAGWGVVVTGSFALALLEVSSLRVLDLLTDHPRLAEQTLLGVMVPCTGLVGAAVLARGVLARQRPRVDRVAFGGSMIMASTLLIAHHAIGVNGVAMNVVAERAAKLERLVTLPGPAFEQTCKALDLECREASEATPISEGVEPMIAPHLEAYYQAARERGPGRFRVSIPHLDTRGGGFAAAIASDGRRWRRMIERDFANRVFVLQGLAFSVMGYAAIGFWMLAPIVISEGHALARRRRVGRAWQRGGVPGARGTAFP